MSTKYKFHEREGLYFVTFATVGWAEALSRPKEKDIVVESIRFCQQEKGLRLHAWVIMSNHVHLVCRASGTPSMSDILRDLKKFTARKIIASLDAVGESRREWLLPLFRAAGANNSNNSTFQLWQQENHPVLLSGQDMMEQKINYIHENPVRAGLVVWPEHYPYSSALSPGLLELET